MSDDRIRSEVRRLAESLAPSLGVEVVEVMFHRAGRFTHLRVDIDRIGPAGVTLEDCQRFSEALGPALDENGLIESHYNLEISSPGTDRPIRTDDDVRRNAGRRVAVETVEPFLGQRRLAGVLLGLEDGALKLRLDGGEEASIPREKVASARQDVTVSGPKERGKRVV